MAKKKHTYWIDDAVFERLKGIANETGTSQAEIIELAIIEAYGNSECAVEVVEAAMDTGRVSENGRGEGMMVGQICIHCDEEYPLKPGRAPGNLCPGCFVRGHRAGSNCRECASQRDLQARKEADTIAYAAGREDIVYDQE